MDLRAFLQRVPRKQVYRQTPHSKSRRLLRPVRIRYARNHLRLFGCRASPAAVQRPFNASARPSLHKEHQRTSDEGKQFVWNECPQPDKILKLLETSSQFGLSHFLKNELCKIFTCVYSSICNF